MINERNAKMFCIDNISLIENYEDAVNDPSETWVCHHRMETHRRNGKPRVTPLSTDDLVDWRIYCNRPASELIFLNHSEHRALHNKHATIETRKKWSDNAKRRHPVAWNKGKKMPEEQRIRLSEAKKGKRASEETRIKMSLAHKGNKSSKGMHWYNNGIVQCTAYECPEGFVAGKLKKGDNR